MASIDNICWDSVQKTSRSEDESTIIDTSMQNLSVFFSDGGRDTSLDDEGDRDDTMVTPDNTENIRETIDNFLTKIKASGVSCPLMAMREPFSSKFVPKKHEDIIHDLMADDVENDLNVIQLFLHSLFNPAYQSMSLHQLRDIADGIQLAYTQEEIIFIERKYSNEIFLLSNISSNNATFSW